MVDGPPGGQAVDVRIRRYLPSDQGAVVGLFREFMWELAPPHLGAQFQVYTERAIREELSRVEEYYFGREGQGFWVADENRVVGMVGVEKQADGAAELRRMAVESARRRNGLGRALPCARGGLLPRRRLSQGRAQHLRAAGRRHAAVRVERLPPGARGARRAGIAQGGRGLTRYHYEKALR